MSGTHSGQAASILEQILPAISVGPPHRLDRGLARGRRAASAAAPAAAQHLRGDPLRAAFHRARRSRSPGTVITARLSADETGSSIGAACAETALSSARQYLSSTAFPAPCSTCLKSAIVRAVKGDNRAVAPVGRHRGPEPGDGRPRRDTRLEGARRPRRDPQIFRGARHGPGRGRLDRGGPHRHAEGGAERSRQAHRRVPVRGPDRHGQDRACEDARRIPVRLGGPHDPPRHERISRRRNPPGKSSARRIPRRRRNRSSAASASSPSRSSCSTSSRRRMRRSGTCSCRCSTMRG